MALTLSTLRPAGGSRRKYRRIGRGPGSGRGTYSGRGRKGQKARAGGRKKLKLKGLRKLVEHLPKVRGFRSRFNRHAIAHCYDLHVFENGTVVTPKLLQEKGVVHDIRFGIKILGDGILTKALTIKDCTVSASAKEKIEKAGGSIVK